jgi:hypothetical protein
MLRQALRSVSEQRARAHIGTVFVSENGGNRQSEAICAEFPELPVKYAFRDPQISPVDHTTIMMNEALVHEHTAILHDDDWWMPDHLANAVEGFREHPEVVAFCSSWFAVYGESSNLQCDPDSLFWIAAEFPELRRSWEITPFQVRFASLLTTPIEFSSMVIRTDALRLSKVVFTLGNNFDIDRMLIVELVNHGPVAYRPYPDVCKRFHPGRDASNFSFATQIQRMGETTRWIAGQAKSDVPGWVAHFRRLKEICPEHLQPQLLNQFEMPWCLPTLRALFPGESFPAVPGSEVAPLDRKARIRSRFSRLRLFVPPVCFVLASRIKRLLRS